MTKAQLMEIQRELKSLGFYFGGIDGAWGNLSHGAFINARRAAAYKRPEGMSTSLYALCKAPAWSAKVSPEFVAEVERITKDLKMGPQGVDEMLSCMAFETGGTFSPTIQNGAGAPYYGIIQFGAAAAKDAGTTIPKLLKMTNVEQVQYVYNFFKPYTGKLKSLSDIYMRILWPAAVGKPDDHVLFDKLNTKSKAYVQNKGLDANRDGKITKGEAAAKVQQKLVEGLHPKNLRTA